MPGLGVRQRRRGVQSHVKRERQRESDDLRHIARSAPSRGEPMPAIRTQVLGYMTVHEEDRDRSREELRRQAQEIISMCARLGLHLLGIVRDRERLHQRPLERPGLGYVLAKVAAGEAGGIVVAELARITHSASEVGTVLEWFARQDARFVAAAPGLDTEDEAGRTAVR